MNCWKGLTAAIALVCAATLSVQAQRVDVTSGSVAQAVARLKAGQYVWEPQIGATTISTGRKGRETPTGVFTILEKQIVHHSSKYDNAPMPYMQRLTWQGVALHAGHLPGYPASHGCIRMPAGFAKLLYGVTTLGMTVVVTSHSTQPRIAPTPQVIASNEDPAAGDPAGDVEWNPGKSLSGPVSIIVSVSDRRAVVLRNGIEIGSGPVAVEGPVTGTWAYALRNVDSYGQHWIRVPLSQSASDEAAVPRSEWQRFKAPESFRKAIASIVQPGTTVVVTVDSLRSGAIAHPVTLMEGGAKGS
jgi:hypothetical protein